MTEPFDLRFLRDVDAPVGEEDEIEIGSDDPDLLPLEGDRVDLGEAAVQTLSLAPDPFPRHPDADRLVRKGVGEGNRVSVRVDHGGRLTIKKKKQKIQNN